MARVLQLAATAYGETSPNPLVGALVTHGETVVGEGVHRRAGGSHAEPLALDAARANGAFEASSGSSLTLYVNLEPCAHRGRTPPCVAAILATPVGRIVAAHVDPDPRVAGRGLDVLRAAGRRVEVGCLAAEAAELNHVFVARQRRRRPFVALKVALAADGSIAAADGTPLGITGGAARRHAHRLRAGLDAVLIGVETLSTDRPRLDRRLYDGPGRDPRRVVIDPNLRAEPAWLWPQGERAVLVCDEAAPTERAARLADVADLVRVPRLPGGLDLAVALRVLESLGVYSLLVEGGGRTHAAFLGAGLWDRVYVYRNLGLRPAGRAWEAAAAWAHHAAGLAPPARLDLDGDRLEVWAHPEAGLEASGAAGARVPSTGG